MCPQIRLEELEVGVVDLTPNPNPNPFREAAITQLKPKKPCPFCIKRWDMHLKPCKHLYQRLRWEANRNAKDFTVGEPVNTGVTLVRTSGERTTIASLPTFFSSYGEWIVPSNRRAWRVLKKRGKKEKG